MRHHKSLWEFRANCPLAESRLAVLCGKIGNIIEDSIAENIMAVSVKALCYIHVDSVYSSTSTKTIILFNNNCEYNIHLLS